MNALPEQRLAAMFPAARVWRAKPAQRWPYVTNAPQMNCACPDALRPFLQSGGQAAPLPGGLLGLRPPIAWLMDALDELALRLPAPQPGAPFPPSRNMALRVLRKLQAKPLKPGQLSAEFEQTALLFLDMARAVFSSGGSAAGMAALRTQALHAMERLLDAPDGNGDAAQRDYLLWIGMVLLETPALCGG